MNFNIIDPTTKPKPSANIHDGLSHGEGKISMV